ncbi:hypothetical protein B7463_g2593, partial [Scytalidium lignicola]
MYIVVFKSMIANLKVVKGDNMKLLYQFIFISSLKDEYPIWAKQDIANKSISTTNSSSTIMYNKNNFNSSNSKSFKNIKYNHYKKNSHKESNYFQKHPKKLEEYKAKQFNKKKKKKSEDKLKKSDSKDKSNIINLNFVNLFNFSSYSMYSDLHLIKTSNSFALINKMYKSAIYINNHLVTRTLGNLRLEELVVKAQDAKVIAKASSSYSPLSPPSTLQDVTLFPQLNSTFEEVVQLTKEEEEVSEDKLPQVVVLTKCSCSRLKGSKNKKPKLGHINNSDITHVDLTENYVIHLAFPDEEEILGQPLAVVIAYSHYLTTCSTLNLGYALIITDNLIKLKSYKEAFDTLYSKE